MNQETANKTPFSEKDLQKIREALKITEGHGPDDFPAGQYNTVINNRRWLATVEDLKQQLKCEQDALTSLENYTLELEASITQCPEQHD